MTNKEYKYVTYPVKLTPQEYEAIKELIDRYNKVSVMKIENIHEFMKLAVRYYIKEIEKEVAELEKARGVSRNA